MIDAILKILIVDDSEVMREALKMQLAELIKEPIIEEAHNGKEALSMVAQFSPDLIIMDVSMPVMNGIEATQQIMQELPEMKIMGFSMNDDNKVIASMKNAGATGFLLKTASIEEMEAKINNILFGAD